MCFFKEMYAGGAGRRREREGLPTWTAWWPACSSHIKAKFSILRMENVKCTLNVKSIIANWMYNLELM
jgi:hypothetical protein